MLRRSLQCGLLKSYGGLHFNIKYTAKILVNGVFITSRSYGVSSSFFDLKDKSNVSSAVKKISKFDNIWLRENCRCDKCYTHKTNQRHVLFHKCDENIQPFEVLEKDGKIKVTWSDGHKSEYDVHWINENVFPGKNQQLQKYYWDSKMLNKVGFPVVQFGEYMSSETGLKTLIESLFVYGFGLVGDVPPNVEGTQKVAEHVSFIQETFFGGLWSFTADMTRADTAYTSIALGAHTDTTYLSTPAGIQVFHCLHHDGEGGETLLVDGFHCADQLRNKDPEAFNMLSTSPIYHEYRETGVYTLGLHTILGVHPSSNELTHLRYNHYDRSPISTIPQEEVGKYYKALRKLSEIIESPENEFWLKLKPGTVLFIDNWRVMHGRAAFTGNRRMSGCYLPRDDWLSKGRVLGLKI